MLPSRLFKNVSIAPHLRSLLRPAPSFPAAIFTPAHLRFYLAARSQSSTASSSSKIVPPSHDTSSNDTFGLTTSQSMPLEPVEPRLSLTFTCTVPDCNTRSTHEFAKRSYEKGIVLVECPGCKNRCVLSYPRRLFYLLFTLLQTSHCGPSRMVQRLHRARKVAHR